MNDRTRTYLRGRFRDYYRRQVRAASGPRPVGPPEPASREWAFVPFTEAATTPMVRHREVHDPAALEEFLVRHRPRHVYHSAARYDDPGADAMGAKSWRGADLVFDLDADHLPGVDAEADSYASMLADCRDATVELVDMLRSDLGFEDLTVVFSGNRGYHVHVRDPEVLELDRQSRRELVEFVRGEGLAFDHLVRKVAVGGGGTRRQLDVGGGWGARVHDRLVAFLADLRERPPEQQLEALVDFAGMGDSRARSVRRVVEERWPAIEAGEVDLHPDFVRFVRSFVEARIVGAGPAIDEPVTTDVHRLIRLPGSLHGKTGLVVRPVPAAALESFDPLEAAVAPTFRENEIAIELREDRRLELGGASWSLTAGRERVPEYVGVFLMAREVAEKVRE
ncbi:MAG: DNA primase small subunit domain-containing protein [Halobacteriales archaeon]